MNETIQENNERIGTTAETNSEITEVDDMDSARALLSEQWDIQQPGALPEGFSVQGYYVYDRNMVEIRYHDEEGHELYYRTSTRAGTSAETRSNTVRKKRSIPVPSPTSR